MPESEGELLRYVGNRIRVAREDAGLSQRQLAKLVGVNQSTVARWERGERDIGIVELSRLCVALGRPARFFLHDSFLLVLLSSPDASQASES